MPAFSTSRFYNRAGLFINPLDDPATFGSIGTGQDEVVIQAAIDKAYNEDIPRVILPYIPGGRYDTYAPLFLDKPDNLRAGKSAAQLLAGEVAAPSSYLGSVMLEADHRTRIYTNFLTAPALWVGTQQDHHLKNIHFTSNINVDNARMRPVNSTGFAVASGSGGASSTTLEDCSAYGFYTAYRTGQNGPDALADNNHLIRFACDNCYIGAWFENAQALINQFINPRMIATRVIRSANPPYKIVGGNLGRGEAKRKMVSISSVSALSTLIDNVPGGGTFTNFQFTTIIASPDAFWPACPDGGFVYSIATVKLPGFGVVPLVTTAFNVGTGVATFKLLPGWTWYHYGEEVSLNSGTDFQNELQAATSLYAIEQCIIAEGPAHLIRPHLETSNSFYTLYDNPIGLVIFEGLENNYPISMEVFKDATGDDLGLFYAAQSHPYIRQGLNTIKIKDSNMTQLAGGNPIVIEGFDCYADGPTSRLIVDNSNFFAPALRYVGDLSTSFLRKGPGYDDTLTSRGQIGSKAGGFGEWDQTVFGPRLTADPPAKLSYLPRAGGTSKTKYHGFRPAPGELQRLTTADVAAIEAASVPGAQQMICGGSLCVVEQLGSQAYTHVKDNGGDFFSYYADLTIDWSYKGQTHLVTVSGTHVNWLFPGLEIGLDNGSGVVWYIVTAYYKTLGYAHVYRKSTTLSVLLGTKTSTYTGSVIKQRAAILQKFGAPI